MSNFGSHLTKPVTDPEVYRLYDAIAARVEDIISLLAEKRRAAVAILKDYTDGLMEQTEAQINPAHYKEVYSEPTETEDDGSEAAKDEDENEIALEGTVESTDDSAAIDVKKDVLEFSSTLFNIN